MKKQHGYLILVLITLGITLSQQKHINSKLQPYACRKAEQMFGNQPLAPEQEKKIKTIASKIGVLDHIVIRKVNSSALMALGYHNVFIYFPCLFSIIPTNAPPYLFVSEGFFEDLSSEEQLFLIGHEMVHIKERHTKYEKLFFLLLVLFFLVLWWILKNQLKLLFKKHIHAKKYSPILFTIQGIFLYICLATPNLTRLAYRRHTEQIADCQSIETLNSHDGAIKIIERWTKDFGLPENNPLAGLLSSHPSCLERKNYCLKFKNKSESKTCNT